MFNSISISQQHVLLSAFLCVLHSFTCYKLFDAHMHNTPTVPMKTKTAAWCCWPDSVRATSVSQTASSQSFQSAGQSVVKEVTRTAGSSASPCPADTQTYGLILSLAGTPDWLFLGTNYDLISTWYLNIIFLLLISIRTFKCKVYFYVQNYMSSTLIASI